jgi:hypothetical protein
VDRGKIILEDNRNNNHKKVASNVSMKLWVENGCSRERKFGKQENLLIGKPIAVELPARSLGTNLKCAHEVYS